MSPAQYVGLKRVAVGGAIAAAILLLPRVGVATFFWWDGRRVTDLPAWLSHQVLWQLSESYPPQEVARWLRSPHPLLEDMAPADVLEAGGEDRVLALIEQLTTGAVA